MAEHTDTDQKVDHVEIAQRHLRHGTDWQADLSAQAHAQIAIAQAFSGIWHELEELNVRLS